MGKYKDSAHLIRLGTVFLLGAILFMVVRAAVIPKSFGSYGPYRGEALAEISSRPLRYAGHEACEGCHPDVSEVKVAGVHAHVNCESCHGPLVGHADDPAAIQPVKPEIAKLCVRCHSQNSAKPSGFPQVDAKQHAKGMGCNTCHKPHSPGFAKAGKP